MRLMSGWSFIPLLTLEDVLHHRRTGITFYWIEDIHHSIVISGDILFNCSSKVDMGPLADSFTIIGENVEPVYEEFITYSQTDNVLTSNNCILWCLVFIEMFRTTDENELLNIIRHLGERKGIDRLTNLSSFLKERTRC